MIRLFRWLFWGDGHAHRWETIETMDLTDRATGLKGTRFHLKCTVCGNIKKRDCI